MILELEHLTTSLTGARDPIGAATMPRSLPTSRVPSKRPEAARRKAAGAAMPSRHAADYILAQRCVRGDIAAWNDIYTRHHDRLCRSIRIMLGSLSDANLVDEIAARVWYALVADDGRLLKRYTPARNASLITFMRFVARDNIRRYVRSELRRRQREATALRQQSARRENAHDTISDSIAGFLATLTSRERKFCHEFLLQPPGDGPIEGPRSAKVWQRTRRLYLKMLDFLN